MSVKVICITVFFRENVIFSTTFDKIFICFKASSDFQIAASDLALGALLLDFVNSSQVSFWDN